MTGIHLLDPKKPGFIRIPEDYFVSGVFQFCPFVGGCRNPVFGHFNRN
jgi:hypothetical protein